MKHLWQVWTDALPAQFCDSIIEKALQRNAVDGTIGFEASTGKVDHRTRSATLRWLDVDGQDKEVADVLLLFAKKTNRLCFGFDIDVLSEVQFTEYHASEGGKYDWHQDVHWLNPYPFDRKVSVVAQLSDPAEYTGGEFEFFGQENPGDQFRKKGSILVFPSWFHHRVLPLTAGVRYSLVTWIEGPKLR